MFPSGKSFVVLVLVAAQALAGCADDPASPSAASSSASANSTATDLSAIGCATDDPDAVGDLTGAWSGNDGGVYYIRHVGDCIWWFGTEIDEIAPGLTGQRGFANVASGRMVGARIDVEWVDLPMGNILGGGGLTLAYDEREGVLRITEQRGDWQPFGATVLTRIDADPSPSASPSESSSP